MGMYSEDSEEVRVKSVQTPCEPRANPVEACGSCIFTPFLECFYCLFLSFFKNLPLCASLLRINTFCQLTKQQVVVHKKGGMGNQVV